MTWFRVDDALPDHRKVRKLGKDRLPAIGLWTLCGAKTSGKRDGSKDGFVPVEVVEVLDPKLRMARRLVEVGLWIEDEDDGEKGYSYHDWAEYRPGGGGRVSAEKKREDTRLRVQAHRGRKRAEQAQRAGDGTYEPDETREPPTDGEPEPEGYDERYESRGNDARNAAGNALHGNASSATCNPAPVPGPVPEESSAPTERPADAGAPPDDPPPTEPPAVVEAAEKLTEIKRAQEITKAYVERVPLSRFPAVLGIVRKAVQSGRYGDEQISEALIRLAAEGRAVTVDSLRYELDGQPPPRQQARPSKTSATVAGLQARKTGTGSTVRALPGGEEP